MIKAFRCKSLLFLALLLLVVGCVSSETIEPRTGIAFEDKIKRTALTKLGLRSKGPIKVYAVGQYGKNIFVLKSPFIVGLNHKVLKKPPPEGLRDPKIRIPGPKISIFKIPGIIFSRGFSFSDTIFTCFH